MSDSTLLWGGYREEERSLCEHSQRGSGGKGMAWR